METATVRTKIDRATGQSGANAAQTVSSPAGEQRRIEKVTVKYSGSVSVSVLLTLNSGAGAAWDVLLPTITLTAATDGVWIPDDEVLLKLDDVLDVLAPAGGEGITSTVAIYTDIAS